MGTTPFITRPGVLFVAALCLLLVCCSEEDTPTNIEPLVDDIPPAAVTDLTAAEATDSSVTLHWTSPGDDSSVGTSTEYDIRYSTSMIDEACWQAASPAACAVAPREACCAETLVVGGLSQGTWYYFALKTADEIPNWSAISNVDSMATAAPWDVTPPASVADLAVVDSTEHTLTLQWTSPGDDGVSGTASAYDLRIAISPIDDGTWDAAAKITGEPSPQAPGNTETFTATNLYSGTEYYFALKTADERPNWSAISNPAHAATLVEDAWSPLGAGTDGLVSVVFVHDGSLMIGGWFTTAGGIPVNNFAAWDGATWSSLGIGSNYGGMALSSYGEDVAASVGNGSFSYIKSWDGVSWTDLGHRPNNTVNALVEYGGHLIAGGNFIEIGAVRCNSIATWNGALWSSLGSGVTGSYRMVYVLTVFDGRLIAGGAFTAAGGVPAANIVAWDGGSWTALGSGMAGTNAAVGAFTEYNDMLIASGAFTSAGGVPVANIAAWNGSSWSALGSGLNAPVFALTVYNGRLIAGGLFTAAGHVGAQYIAAWDGTSWSPLGAGFNDRVTSLTVYNGRLIAGGWYTASGYETVGGIAAWSD